MKTVKDVSVRFQQELAGIYESQEIEAVNLLLLSELLNLSKAKLKAFSDTEISQLQSEQIEKMLQELKTGRPIQYVLGYTDFYGLPFKVNSSVLIPRPETEELVQWIIEFVKSSPNPVYNLLDIGTGSGCIAITLKKHLPQVQVFAIDIAEPALETARQNAELNQVAVTFIHDDILNPQHTGTLPLFNLIVSNPPYVTPADQLQMHRNVTDFEPHSALFVPENDPLLFYNAISNFAAEQLDANGVLFFEINENYGKQTVELLKYKSFKSITLRQDMSNRDRMIKAEIAINA